jgi:hypothetical protein
MNTTIFRAYISPRQFAAIPESEPEERPDFEEASLFSNWLSPNGAVFNPTRNPVWRIDENLYIDISAVEMWRGARLFSAHQGDWYATL